MTIQNEKTEKLYWDAGYKAGEKAAKNDTTSYKERHGWRKDVTYTNCGGDEFLMAMSFKLGWITGYDTEKEIEGIL